MSKFSPLSFISIMLAIATLLVAGACQSHPEDYRLHMAVTGTWQGAQSGTLMTIYQDGRLIIENAPGSNSPIKGQIERGFDQLLIRYITPRGQCGDSVGIYKFECDGEKLTLDQIKEDCALRAGQLDKVWTIKFRTPTSSIK
jgi:hypothetical protein